MNLTPSREAVVSARAAIAGSLSEREATELARVIVCEAQGHSFEDAVELASLRVRIIHEQGMQAGIFEAGEAMRGLR